MPSIERLFADGKGALVTARCAAPPSVAWRLLSTPERWPDWSPQIRAVTAADGGTPSKRLAPGDELAVHGYGPLRVRARITRVEALRWDFDALLAGPLVLTSAHEVVPAADECVLLVGMRFRGLGAALLDRTALTAYLPLAAFAVRRLARLAEHHAALTRPAS